jgi:tRNA(Ile)-lysidine synthase
VSAALAALRASVAAALARHGRRRIDVACSGGPDSLALADAAIAALGAGAVRLLHVDHRQPASAAAAAHLAAWATARGVALAVAAVDVPPGPSWEAQARVVRDRALCALAGDELIATGHTASDQAETVLMRLLRGTGPDGLAAIAPRRGPFVRPLLAHTRAEIEAYVAAAGLDPWRDPMNADPRFTRVWLRQQIVPALAARNPQIERALAQLAALVADDRAALAPVVDALAAEVEGGDGLACAPLAAAPPAIARRVIAAWLTRHGRAAEVDAVAAVLALAAGPAAGTRGVDLAGGRVARVYDRLVIADAVAAPPPLTVLGAAGPYQVRPWQPGDRMRPARLRGQSRKLSDLYGDLKLPRAARAGARVVIAASGAIVWAEHVGPAWQATEVVRLDGG